MRQEDEFGRTYPPGPSLAATTSDVRPRPTFIVSRSSMTFIGYNPFREGRQTVRTRSRSNEVSPRPLRGRMCPRHCTRVRATLLPTAMVSAEAR